VTFLRRLPSSAFKFVVFAVVCVVLLVLLAVRIGNLSLFTSHHTVQAQLADVTGLTSGDAVDIAGVPVGQVSGIAVQRGHALVTMSLNTNVVLHRATDVGLRWKNVIGQKVVYLYPEKQGPLLAPGATIPLSHDVSDASVDAFLNSLGPFLSAINPTEADQFVENVSGALEGDTAEIDQLIDNGATVSHTVGDLDTQVGQVITSLDQVLTAIASRSGDVTSLVSNLDTVAQSLSSHNQLLDDVVGNLSQVAGDVANLVGQNRSTLDGTIDNLKTVTQNLVANQQNLAKSLATLGTGLAPYVEISSYGQWFQIQTVYTCLANQTVCTYGDTGSAPAGSGPGGGSPLPAPLTAANGATPSSSISSILGAVAGGAGSGGAAGGTTASTGTTGGTGGAG